MGEGIDRGLSELGVVLPLRVNTSGQLEVVIVSGLALIGVQVFTADGIWAKSSNVRGILVKSVGAGGGGGGCAGVAGQAAVGGGGGSAGYCEEFIDADNLGATETVTVGVGGAGGAAGNNAGSDGEATTFGAHHTAGGGAGGAGQAASATAPRAGGNPGLGGTAVGGDLNIPGSQGGIALIVATTLIFVPRQTATPLCSPRELGALGTDADGFVGANYGGGGGGGRSSNDANDRAGGDGAPGICIVYEFGLG